MEQKQNLNNENAKKPVFEQILNSSIREDIRREPEAREAEFQNQFTEK